MTTKDFIYDMNVNHSNVDLFVYREIMMHYLSEKLNVILFYEIKNTIYLNLQLLLVTS